MTGPGEVRAAKRARVVRSDYRPRRVDGGGRWIGLWFMLVGVAGGVMLTWLAIWGWQ